MLTFEQFLRNAAAEGRSVNYLWEEHLFDVLGVTEKLTVPLSIRSMDAAGLITADVEAALPEKALSRLQNIRDTE